MMTAQNRPRRHRRVAGRLWPRRPAECLQDAVPLTSTVDRWEHRVLSSVYTRAMTEGHGECRALCRTRVVMAAFASPPGPPCPACVAIIDGDIEPRT